MNLSPLKKHGSKLLACAAIAVGLTASTSAHADETRGVDWTKILVQTDRLLRTGNAEAPQAQPKPRQAERLEPVGDPSAQNLGNAWFGVAPRVTLVARDWASSTRLAGERLGLADTMRLTSSTRMIVGRMRLSATRFTPFLQLGFGQWRVDRAYLPLTPQSIEIAAQLGTGFEMRVSRRWRLAAEATATTLVRENSSNTVPQTTLYSTLLAARAEF